ncbi:hypothetical protein [Euzebya sp.]|uniref:hypothetical protein n=1 Tax=Euzebya sp. TaxID=1971409 RepID=UPI003517F7EB
MGEVVLDPDAGAFATLLGGLLRANLEADPAKGRLVDDARGTVALTVSDRDEEVVLTFAGGTLEIGGTTGVAALPTPDADLRLAGTADAIMGLTTVPLRFGLPDLLSSGGRALTGRWVAGGLEVHGLPRGAPLLRTTLSLLSVIR